MLHGARKVGRYALLIFVAFLVLFPIYATLMQALKSGPDAIDHPRSLLPIDFTLDTLRAAWTRWRPRAADDQQHDRRRRRHVRRDRHQPARRVRVRLPRLPRQGTDLRLLPRHVAGAGRADGGGQPAHHRLAGLGQQLPRPDRAVAGHDVRHVPRAAGVPDSAEGSARGSGARRRRALPVPVGSRRAAVPADAWRAGVVHVPRDVEPVPVAVRRSSPTRPTARSRSGSNT